MPVAPNMGVLAQLGMDPSGTLTEAYEFISESITGDRTIINAAGIRGSRSQNIERLRQGTLAIGGTVVLNPTPTELRKLLPRILGAAEVNSGGYYTYSLAEALPAGFKLGVDRVAKVYTYSGCAIDKATFRSQAGGLLELSLDIEALTEAIGAAGTFPALTIDATAPFTHFDAVLTLGGTAYQMHSVELVIDNQLKKDRFVNSQTRTDLPSMGRLVTLNCVVPYTSDTVGLYDGGASGVTANLKYSVGGAGDGGAGIDVNFLLQNICFPAKKSPAVQNKDEITLTLQGQVYKTGSNAELQVRVDNVA